MAKIRKSAAHAAPPKARALGPELDRADELMRQGRWIQARDLLQDLAARYPRSRPVLTDLANVYIELEDSVGYQFTCEQLLEIDPGNDDAALGLAGAYLSNAYPASALQAFKKFINKWPRHARADEVRQTIADLEARLPELLADIDMQSDEWQIALWHEEAQIHMAAGRHVQARRAAEELIKRKPDFAPAYNNLSLIYWLEGKLDQAIAAAHKVLSFAPDNVHALSNMIRFLCTSGRIQEARAYAERLKASTATAWEVWNKKAEGLTYVGDDAGVIEIYKQMSQEATEARHQSNASVAHLAGVAALRLGREDEARRYWQQALKYQPGFELAQANLDDLRKPVGERQGPWPFPFNSWISRKTVEALMQSIQGKANQNPERLKRSLQNFLERCPHVAALAPQLLERGDPSARAFALLIARTAQTPELLNALKEFALSQHGPDQARLEAAQAASEAGLLPTGMTRMWMRGEWQEMLMMGIEVHGEPEHTHSPRVEKLARDGASLLNQGKWQQAEQIFKQGLEVEPDAPDLLNNLALAYKLQGREQEAEAMLRQIHERYPDYLFAHVGLAQYCIERGELEQARQLLDPLLQRKRLHFSEFDALCGAQILLLLAEGKQDAARSWFEMWKSADPNNPKLEPVRRMLDKPAARPKWEPAPIDWERLLGRKRQ